MLRAYESMVAFILVLMVPGIADAQESPPAPAATAGVAFGVSAPGGRYGEIRSPGPEVALAAGLPLTPWATLQGTLTWARHPFDSDGVRRQDPEFIRIRSGGASTFLLFGAEVRLAPPVTGPVRIYGRGGVGALRFHQDALEVVAEWNRPNTTGLTRTYLAAVEFQEVAPAIRLGIGVEGRTGRSSGAGVDYYLDMGLVRARFDHVVDAGGLEPSHTAASWSLSAGVVIRFAEP